jgi:hypothetical protein
MSMALSLPNDAPLPATPSHSTCSFDHPPSTPSSTTDSVRPKPQRRISLGVLESAKFRLSHDVRWARGLLAVPLLSPSVPNTCCTHVFFAFSFFRSLHVSFGRPVLFLQSRLTQEGQPWVHFLLLPSKRGPSIQSADASPSACPHRAHTARAR